MDQMKAEPKSARSTSGDRGALEQQIAALAPWYHNLHLPDGTQTAPDHALGDYPLFKWQEIAGVLPARLDGLTVLDVGCNAGFYSFELASRGAIVTAIDVSERYLAQARWAAGIYGLEEQILFRRMQVYDLARTTEEYDIVLFLGVFYHLRYPLLGLDIIARKVRGRMLFQSLTMPGETVYTGSTAARGIHERDHMLDPGWPKMAFIEHRFANDPTNWWAPNHAGIEAMLRSSGFRVVARPSHEFYLCEPDRQHPSCTVTWDADEYLSATGFAQSPGDTAESTPLSSSGQQ